MFGCAGLVRQSQPSASSSPQPSTATSRNLTLPHLECLLGLKKWKLLGKIKSLKNS